MTDETTKNFWEVWNNFQPPEPKPISYRAYYNEDGIVNHFTTEDSPGNYVEIDRETFVRYPAARVVDGKLQLIKAVSPLSKLQPADHGTACDPRDVCVIVSEDQPHTKWAIVNNEIN